MSEQVVRAAAKFLASHLSEPISWEDAADHVGYSPFHFSRLFARTVRVPPGKFLSALRFAAAKELLLGDTDPIVEVCAAVGYSSPATFTRRFTAAVGTPPARFRRLADTLAEGSPRPFAIGSRTAAAVQVRLRLPDTKLRRPWNVWLGWYSAPVPFGLPSAGCLLHGPSAVSLPLCPGAPYLLAFAVDPAAEASSVLAPRDPLVAVWAAPLTRPAAVELIFGPPPEPAFPLLSALPSLVNAQERTHFPAPLPLDLHV